MQTSNEPYAIEKILSAATYLTASFVGFVWLIIAALSKKTVRPFLMYHILQSIFISMLFFVISLIWVPISYLVNFIPLVNLIPIFLQTPLPFAFGLSAIQVFTTTVILYLAITSFLGYYSYLPIASDIIKGNLRR